MNSIVHFDYCMEEYIPNRPYNEGDLPSSSLMNFMGIKPPLNILPNHTTWLKFVKYY
jgi:hypothetical protein